MCNVRTEKEKLALAAEILYNNIIEHFERKTE